MTGGGHADPYEGLGAVRRRAATVALLGCAFLAMLDGTVVGTALPRIVERIGGDDSWYVWLVTAYLLSSSVSVPVYGRFSDLYGRRLLLLGGLGVFLAGSLACGLAGSMPVLIVARAVQGLGGGALLTLGMALVRDLHPPERGGGLVRMQTAMGAMLVLGMVGGPLLGGVLADHADWRWAFWMNLPLGAAAAAVLWLLLPERRPERARGGRLDVAGLLLLSAGLSLVLVAFSLRGNAPDGGAGWADPAVAGSLVAGVALLGALLPVERRAAVPVLPLRLFRRPTYGSLLLAGFFFQLAALPVGVLLPLYFQHVRGQTATVSGLSLLPFLIGSVVGNRLTAAAALRTGRTKPALVTGACLLLGGTAGFLWLDPATGAVPLTCRLLVAGLGSGPAMGGLMIATQNCVPRSDMGAATAGAMLAKQIGGAFGLAVVQTVLGARGPDAAGIGTAVGGVGAVAGALALVAVAVPRGVRVPSRDERATGPEPAAASRTAN